MPGLSVHTKNTTEHSLLFKWCKILLHFRSESSRAINKHLMSTESLQHLQDLLISRERPEPANFTLLHHYHNDRQLESLLSLLHKLSKEVNFLVSFFFSPQHLNSAALHSNHKWQSHFSTVLSSHHLSDQWGFTIKHCRKKLPKQRQLLKLNTLLAVTQMCSTGHTTAPRCSGGHSRVRMTHTRGKEWQDHSSTATSDNSCWQTLILVIITPVTLLWPLLHQVMETHQKLEMSHRFHCLPHSISGECSATNLHGKRAHS